MKNMDDPNYGLKHVEEMEAWLSSTIHTDPNESILRMALYSIILANDVRAQHNFILRLEEVNRGLENRLAGLPATG